MGKTIKIYLPTENVSGIRHAEITNWSGQALACPRSRFQELREWPEVQRPGVYLLFGVDDETGRDAVYIGEAEVVIDRLASHVSNKRFWSEVVAFTSKDENLTKGHVRYLEARLIGMARHANRYHLTNSAFPPVPLLPRSERDAMEEYLVSVKMLLGSLGFKVLDPLLTQSPKFPITQPATNPDSVGQDEKTDNAKDFDSSPVFHLRVAEIHAQAVSTDEGMVVLEGSEASASTYKSITGSMLAIRQNLIESGALIPFGAKMRLTRNHLFKSASQAGGVLAGYSINGREYWRLDDGTTYAQHEAKVAESVLQGLENS